MAGKDIFDHLSEKISAGNIIADCDMREHTSFRAGGRAKLLVIPQDAGELRHALAALSRSGLKYMVIGNGSNILVKDDGYTGALIKLGGDFSRIKTECHGLAAGAGALLSSVARSAMEAGLSGLEFASGIPGSVGGAVFMNAGAYDGEMSHVVYSAKIISSDGGREYVLQNGQMEFGYRHSVLQATGDVAINVTFKLIPGEPETIGRKMRELAERRNKKQPMSMPSAGSFFKRPEGHFAGQLIQDAGLKGLSVGGARISPLHAGFIVNQGGATASDIIDLMNLVRNSVYDKFGVRLEPEVRIIGD